MILGLDLATKTGWCLLDGGKIVASGVQDFSKRRGESNGILFLRFQKWLVELLAMASCRVNVVAYEQAHFRGGAATELCVGLQTHTQSVAAEYGAESVPVATSTLKLFATGSGKADKVRMMAEARKILGRDPEDDNEADAVHVARWGYAEFGVNQNADPYVF